MKADEAAELMDKEGERDLFKRRAAVTIAIFAMFLAITSLGGSNATKEALNANILASDAYAFFQAKNIRQTSNLLAADALEAIIAGQRDLPAAARDTGAAKVDQYRKTAAWLRRPFSGCHEDPMRDAQASWSCCLPRVPQIS